MHFEMSSVICLNLDKSKILSSGNELNKDWSKLSLRDECVEAALVLEICKCCWRKYDRFLSLVAILFLFRIC